MCIEPRMPVVFAKHVLGHCDVSLGLYLAYESGEDETAIAPSHRVYSTYFAALLKGRERIKCFPHPHSRYQLGCSRRASYMQAFF